ncbi:hypothetical protein LPJ61_005876 [Coemansia biformis]|uniref:Uncharacterized protein n=1 Tax=Coemansia biformis TaxID=1286918 RepID=A0A9W7Y0V6_9FUNG|nr:hypothetical protein LPJ61_005876 [Coemansia biformis]
MSAYPEVGVLIERLVPIGDSEISSVPVCLSDTRTELRQRIDAKLRLENRQIGPYQIHIRQSDGSLQWLYGAKTVRQCLGGRASEDEPTYVIILREVDISTMGTSTCCTVL